MILGKKRFRRPLIGIVLVFCLLLCTFNLYAGGLPDGVVDNTPPQPESPQRVYYSAKGNSLNAAGAYSLDIGTIYNLRPSTSSTSYLNVYAGTDANGTKVCTWSKDGSKEQKFKLISGSESGTYKLQAVCSSSGRVLDAYSKARPIQSGAQADIWAPSDNTAQNLYIYSNGDGTFRIKLASFSTLGLTAVSTGNNGTIKFNTISSTSPNSNQRWYFEPISSTVRVTGVSLNYSSAPVSVGATKALTATVSPSNATNKSITWTSSNTAVATVSSSGVVTGKAAGTATITVKTADGGYTATCTVTVSNPTVKVTGVTLSPTSPSINVGATKALTATVSPSTATNKSVTWTSSNTAVATVSSSGVVTGKAAGTATITVKTADGGYTATCMVTVTNVTPTNPYAALNWAYFHKNSPLSCDISEKYAGYSGHYGFDVVNSQLGKTLGAEIYPVENGTVRQVGLSLDDGDSDAAGYFIALTLDQKHPITNNNIVVNYMHLRDAPTLAAPNQATGTPGAPVTKGQTILGYVGDTGNVTGPHVHFEISNTGKTFPQSYAGTDNPILYFPNIAFTGKTDATEVNSTASFRATREAISMNIIDISLINQVGRDKVDNWFKNIVKNNPQKQYTINDFREYFKISDTEFKQFVIQKGLSDLYNADKIVSFKSVK